MKKILMLLSMTVGLSACGTENIDGTYAAFSKPGFLTPAQSIILKLTGEKAILEIGPKTLEMKARFKDGILDVYEQTPKDGFTFQLKNKGNTLECLQCKQVGIPTDWNKAS